MPLYEFAISAKIFVKEEGKTLEEACSNLEAYIEDGSMSSPNGFYFKLGDKSCQIFLNDTKPTFKRKIT